MLIQKEQILSESDPLFLICHSLEKIKFITDVIMDNPGQPQNSIMTAMDILGDAKGEIELILDACNEKWNQDHAEIERLRKENEKLKCCLKSSFADWKKESGGR